VDDVNRDADDARLDVAFVGASSNAEQAALTPPVSPRVGAQLQNSVQS